MANDENLFISADGYEYLESYLMKLYGERGSFKHNLMRYAESDEFRSHSHVINAIDDINEISFEQLVGQVERESFFQSRAHEFVQWYDNLSTTGELNADAIYEAAGFMGLAPGRENWFNTLFPHLLDLFVSSPEEGLKIEKSCESNLAIMRLIVSGMMDGIRGKQIIRHEKHDIYSQGYVRNLWRGENAYNKQCYASMFRNRPDDPVQAQIYDFIGHLRMIEFSLWLNKLSFVSSWPYGDVFHGAIAQHYGIPTNAIDLSADLKSSIFFACTEYENGKFRKLRPEEFKKKESRANIAARNGDSRYAILFQAPYDVIRMSSYVDDKRLHFTSATPIGYQPFMRCGNQRGFVIETGPGFDLYREPCFSKYKFRLTPEICDWAFQLVDGDNYLYPDEAFGNIDDIIVSVKNLNLFSEKAFKLTLSHLKLENQEAFYQDALLQRGISIQQHVGICSVERKQEIEELFRKNGNGYMERIANPVFRFGFCL